MTVLTISISYMLVGTFSMSYIIKFYKLYINLIYAYAIEFLIKKQHRFILWSFIN
jgi:hypothetical protein